MKKLFVMATALLITAQVSARAISFDVGNTTKKSAVVTIYQGTSPKTSSVAPRAVQKFELDAGEFYPVVRVGQGRLGVNIQNTAQKEVIKDGSVYTLSDKGVCEASSCKTK